MKFALAAGALALSLLGHAAQAQAPQGAPAAPPANAVSMPSANWLFVQTAASASVEGNTLTLKGVSPQTLMFTDRPERMTGDAPTAKFVSYWTSGKSDFQKDPPNATLSVDVDGTAHVAVVELTEPKLDGDTLTYTIKVLGDKAPVGGKAASLFIDWWYGPGWGPAHYWRPGPWGGWGGGACWRGPWGGLHCRPAWAW
ncbi:MAG: hypothetical protein PGN34_23850 [Methylobacterium frigidaeris]